MSRVLVAARVSVGAAAEPEYLAGLAALARHHEARGRRVWLFRNERDPREFLEFREGPAGSADLAGPEEEAADARLRRLARYHEADARWLEVRLPRPEK
jgi:hypothetical protein